MFDHKKQMQMEPVQITSLLSNSLNLTGRSHLITTILKYFIFEKQQIPYSYENFKKLSASEKEQNGIRERHKMTKLKKTFQEFEQVFKELGEEMEKNNVEEVVLLLGTTIYNPKDILRIPVPGAIQSLGGLSLPKLYFIVLRSLLESKDLDKLLNHQIGLTNIYLFIKVINGCKSEFFLPKERFTLSNKCRQAIINLSYSDEMISKNEIVSPRRANVVLSDSNTSDDLCSNPSTSDTASASQPSSDIEWFQSKITIKGFK